MTKRARPAVIGVISLHRLERNASNNPCCPINDDAESDETSKWSWL